MKEALKRYKRKCGRRTIDFALHEHDIYAFSKEINFAAFVKEALRKALEEQLILEGFANANL